MRGVKGYVLPTKNAWRPPRLDHAAALVAVLARSRCRTLGPRILQPRVARNSGRRACGCRICGERPVKRRRLRGLRRCDRSFTRGRLDRVNDSVVETRWSTTVKPPEGITAGEQLAVEVYAIDPSGKPLCNALVEITWELPGQRYRVYGRTSPLGRMTSRRLLPRGCDGKRCAVAVRVSSDQLEAVAYSTFVPK